MVNYMVRSIFFFHVLKLPFWEFRHVTIGQHFTHHFLIFGRPIDIRLRSRKFNKGLFFMSVCVLQTWVSNSTGGTADAPTIWQKTMISICWNFPHVIFFGIFDQIWNQNLFLKPKFNFLEPCATRKNTKLGFRRHGDDLAIQITKTY